MATIPDVNAVGNVAPGGRQQPIIRLPGAHTQEALDYISKDVNQLAQIRDESEYSKAKAKFLMVKAEQDNAYNDREDFDAFDQEYTHNMSEASAVGASLITDARVRDRFVSEVDVMQEQGRQRILQVAGEKEKDQERSTIEDEIDTLTRTTLNNDGDVVEAYNTIKTRLDAAAKMNVVTYEYAQNKAEATRSNMAQTKLRGMDPQDRIDALNDKSGFIQFIDPAVVKQLRDEAKSQLRIAEAQGEAFRYIDQGLDRNQALRQIYKDHAKDPLKMNAVKDAFNEAYSTNLVTETEVQNNSYDEIHLGVGMGDTPVSFYKDPKNEQAFSLWSSLSPPQRDNLEQIAANRLAGTVRKVSDKQAWEKLYQSMIDAQGGKIKKAEFDRDYMLYSNALKPSDYEMFYKFKAGNNDELISAATVLNNILQSVTISDEKKQNIRSDVLTWYSLQKDKTGVAPSDRETTEYINAAMSTAPGSGNIWDDKAYDVNNMDDRIDSYLNPNTTAAQRKYLRESAWRDGNPDNKQATIDEFEWRVIERETPELLDDLKAELQKARGIDITYISDPTKRMHYLKMYKDALNATQ